ncbi:aldo/keto reductase [Aquimarina sp. LLG6339-5]|uniref:aldo/keto reductase n=1 Tax=Aquimarina sp. LLG6339-5 TaxID=3160830 RepID=UPI00386626C6
MILNSKIGLGTVQFGIDYGISNAQGKTSNEEVSTILNYAKSIGIEYLDTAPAYGDAEKTLGFNDLSSFKIVSKFININSSDLESQLKQSLDNLNISKLYGYIAHRPNEFLDNMGSWDILQSHKQEGVIERIGFSLNNVKELDTLLIAGMIPDLVQVPYNYFDRRFEDSIKILKKNGCEIHTRSTFLQGLFFCDPSTLDNHFDEAKALLTTLKEYGNDLPKLLLKFCLEKDFIDNVIIGVNNIEQLKQNMEDWKNSPGHLNDIEFNMPDRILIPSMWPSNS